MIAGLIQVKQIAKSMVFTDNNHVPCHECPVKQATTRRLGRVANHACHRTHREVELADAVSQEPSQSCAEMTNDVVTYRQPNVVSGVDSGSSRSPRTVVFVRGFQVPSNIKTNM